MEKMVVAVELKNDESLDAVRQRFEVNGWDFKEVIHSGNKRRTALFSKPDSAPDYQPFLDANVKL